MDDGNESDTKVVQFPQTDQERQALRKAKQRLETQRLVAAFIADDRSLFVAPDGTAFADLIIEGARQTWPIRSARFRAELIAYVRRQSEQLTNDGSVLGPMMTPALRKHQINAIIDDFEMRAISSSIKRDVRVRVAAHDGDIYIDLADAGWRAVKITGTGWSIVESPPVRFQRTSGMLALPVPERGTPISALRQFLNVGGSDFVLVVAFLLAALRPTGPYPILACYGEQGAGKTGFIRRLRALIDPNLIPTSALPSSGRDLFVAARNTHLQAFENVSKLSDSLSDLLCVLATGGGWRTRTLFKSADETLFRAARPIAAEGISNFVTRPDLQDRSIVLPIDPPSYRTERELDAAFERQRAGIFGALLDRLVQGLRMLPETHLAHPPRLADFAHWSVACGLDGFEAAYLENRQRAIDIILEHEALAQAVQALVTREWRGTAAELLDEIGPTTRIKNAKVLADELRRIAPLLRTKGFDIKHERTNARREITIVR